MSYVQLAVKEGNTYKSSFLVVFSCQMLLQRFKFCMFISLCDLKTPIHKFYRLWSQSYNNSISLELKPKDELYYTFLLAYFFIIWKMLTTPKVSFETDCRRTRTVTYFEGREYCAKYP